MPSSIPLSEPYKRNDPAAAAFYCHSFNLAHKGQIDDISAGDETYIKVLGKQQYVFFFISTRNLKITAYHVADNRGTQPAVIAMNEARRNATPGQEITFVSDGNPAPPHAAPRQATGPFTGTCDCLNHPRQMGQDNFFGCLSKNDNDVHALYCPASLLPTSQPGPSSVWQAKPLGVIHSQLAAAFIEQTESWLWVTPHP